MNVDRPSRDDVCHEFARQRVEEGWSAEHDQQHANGELIRAALAYVTRDEGWWPWDNAPKFGPRDLVKAGALLLAEDKRREIAERRLHSWAGLMSLLDEHWPEGIFTGESGDEGARIVALIRLADRWKESWHIADQEWRKDQIEIARLRREVEFWANGRPVAVNGLSLPACACVSDDQANHLANAGFTRPVCAVHAPGWPISTLTGMPCGHSPDARCVECTEEGGVRPAPLPGTPWAEGGEPA